MSAIADEFLARAAAFRAEADRSTLPRVKERCARSAEAWEAMAERHVEHERLKRTSALESIAVAAPGPNL